MHNINIRYCHYWYNIVITAHYFQYIFTQRCCYGQDVTQSNFLLVMYISFNFKVFVLDLLLNQG